jgi:outer membrane protein TolC
LEELARLVSIAEQLARAAEAQHERGVMPVSEMREAEAQWIEAQVRYARAAGQSQKLAELLRKIVELREKTATSIAEQVRAGRVSIAEQLEAERKLSEARLELHQATPAGGPGRPDGSR